MNDMIEALYPSILKLANKIDGSTCDLYLLGDEVGRISQPAIKVNWQTRSEIDFDYWLIIDTEGIRFHQEYETHHDYRLATQNIQWTDPNLLEKITNFMTPPHPITPDTTIIR